MYLAYCSNCGNEIDRSARFCRECGHQVGEDAPPTANAGVTTGRERQAHETYRTPRPRANWTVRLLIALSVASAIGILANQAEVNLIDRALAGHPVSKNEFDDMAALVGFVALVEFALFVGTVVAFAMWMHRASSNLRPLMAFGQRFSPGWAVGWWFIPIANLWKPYQAMKEIWQGSDPEMSGDKAGGWERAPVWNLLGWWWGVWIIGGMVDWSAARSGWTAQTQEEIRSADQVYMVSEALTIAVSILAILLVRRITSRQEEKYRAVRDRPIEGREQSVDFYE